MARDAGGGRGARARARGRYVRWERGAALCALAAASDAPLSQQTPPPACPPARRSCCARLCPEVQPVSDRRPAGEASPAPPGGGSLLGASRPPFPFLSRGVGPFLLRPGATPCGLGRGLGLLGLEPGAAFFPAGEEKLVGLFARGGQGSDRSG